MDNNRYWELLGKKTSGELSLQEQIELNNLIKEDEHKQDFVHFLNDVMNTSTRNNIDKDEAEEFIAGVQKKISVKKSEAKVISPGWYKYVAVAACVIILLAGFYYFFNTSNQYKAPNVVTTKKGSKSSIVLPDGTKVWINSDSKLTYDENFGVKSREIMLDGEAYFDVTKDANKPFVVKTTALDVLVLGTAFNVRAYNNEKNTQTTLVRGVVEVVLKNRKDKKITLQPNEKLMVQNNYYLTRTGEAKKNDDTEIVLSTIQPRSSDSTLAETGWVSNKLIFNQEKLEDIIPVLERWYNVKINLRKQPNNSRKLSGTYNNDNLKDVLESLKLAGEFSYSIEKEEVNIY